MAEKIRALREAKRWSQTDLASRVGVSQVTIAKIETGKIRHTSHIGALARALGVTVDELEVDAPEQGRGLADVVPVRAGYKPPPVILGDHNLPVYASAEGGNGAIVVSTDPIEFVPRPWFLEKFPESYAVLVNGTSMEPVYQSGDMVLVNPRLPLVKGKDVILVRGEDEGQFEATVKRLVNWTQAEWHLRQFNPPEGQQQDFRKLRQDWPKALRIVGKYDGY